jgi:cation diffusion facilitator CzcD-associated flavoprotein CzcO
VSPGDDIQKGPTINDEKGGVMTDNKPVPRIATPKAGLAQLEAQILRDLDWLDYPKRDWVVPHYRPNGERILDVLIIGGGQGGLSVAFGLMREKVRHLLVVDQNPEGYEGPWKTFARMITLRTPKYLTGPDHGIPHLTIRAWYEAQHGEEAWENLTLIPKETWADYLHWYRTFLNIPVRNNTQAGPVVWNEAEGCFAIPLNRQGATETVYARKVVFATGIEGSGQWDVPAMIRDGLPSSLYRHTRQDIDFEALKGKRIGVLGAGASAFDNASVALESGAAEVRLFFRRQQLPNVNPYRWAENVGFLKHHADLGDADRWRFILQILRMGQLPPSDTFTRARSFPNFHLQPGSSWRSVKAVEGPNGPEVEVTTETQTFTFDFLIIGTGFVTDLSLRPELAHEADQIALWSQRYTAPPAWKNDDMARHPYLGASFEYQEREPGTAPYLNSLFNYTFGGLVSLGFGGGSISGMKYSLPRIIGGITRQLYTEDADAHFESLAQFDIEEFPLEVLQ